jgi:hypothetical protein
MKTLFTKAIRRRLHPRYFNRDSMEVVFEASVAWDLKRIKNKNLIKRGNHAKKETNQL